MTSRTVAHPGIMAGMKIFTRTVGHDAPLTAYVQEPSEQLGNAAIRPAVLILPLFLEATGIQMAQSAADLLTLLCAIPIHLHVMRSLPKTDG